MNRTTYLLLALLAFTGINCQCDSTAGFLTEMPAVDANAESYFLNATEILGDRGDIYPPGEVDYAESILYTNLNFTMQFSPGGCDGLWTSWTLGDNGDMTIPFWGDCTDVDQGKSIIFYFDPPVNALVMKTNYDPDFPSNNWGPPTWRLLGASGQVEECYNIHALAPISTPDGVNAFEIRGVAKEAGISALQIQGSQLVVWDIVAIRNFVPPQAPPVEAPVAAPVEAPVAAPTSAPVSTNTPLKSDATKTVASVALVALYLLLQ